MLIVGFVHSVFAYTGGLFFFMRNFLNALSHYLWMSLSIAHNWWHDHGEEHLSTFRQQHYFTGSLFSSSNHSIGNGLYGRSRPSSKQVYSEDESVDQRSESEELLLHASPRAND